MLKKEIKKRFQLLQNPEKGFGLFTKMKFEEALGEYLKLLLTMAVLAGIFSFLFSIGKAFYFNILYDVDIQYANMLNYSLGKANGLVFFYLFFGTFLMFFLSLILNAFFKRIKYTRLLELLFVSFTPYLIFGWIPFFSLALIVWTIFLFVLGVKFYETEKSSKKKSFSQRD